MFQAAAPVLLVLFGALLLHATPSNASEACSALVREAVQDRLTKDFPAELLIADLPDTSMVDGGSEYSVDVPVRRTNDKIAYATYSVLVGETCQVLSVELKR